TCFCRSGESLLAYPLNWSTRTTTTVELWLRHNGFVDGPRGLRFPDDFRRRLSLDDIRLERTNQSRKLTVHNLGGLIECLSHVVGVWNPPGVPRSISLPLEDTAKCTAIIYNHLSALICFVEAQGGCLSHIFPEYLMTHKDYIRWIEHGRPCGYDQVIRVDGLDVDPSEGNVIIPKTVTTNFKGNTSIACSSISKLSPEEFECISRIAWTDLFLQLIKCFEMRPLWSKSSEHELLSWVNSAIGRSWRDLCEENGRLTSSTWHRPGAPKVANFDTDFSNGLALACLIAHHVPFIVKESLSELILDPHEPQDRFHNCIQIVKALALIHVDFQLTPDDIYNTSDVYVLLLLTRLYQCLPGYAVKSSLAFEGNLQALVQQDLTLTNPTNQKLVYRCFVIGDEGHLFGFVEPSHRGKSKTPRRTRTKQISLAGNCPFTLHLCYKVQSLRRVQAHLMLIAEKGTNAMGSAMVFELTGEPCSLQTDETFHFNTTCYRPQLKLLSIRNRLRCEGVFAVRLVESPRKPITDSASTGLGSSLSSLRGFTCKTAEVRFRGDSEEDVDVVFHPFGPGVYAAKLIFSNQSHGDFVIDIRGSSELPLPDQEQRITCPIGLNHRVELLVTLENVEKMHTLEWLARYLLSRPELERISMSRLLLASEMSKILALHNSETASTNGGGLADRIHFRVECNSAFVKVPPVIEVPLKERAHERPMEHFNVPLTISCDTPGSHHVDVLLIAPDDLRRIQLECVASVEATTPSTVYSMKAHEESRQLNGQFSNDCTTFVTDDWSKLAHTQSPTNQTDLECLLGGRIDIKCRVGRCVHTGGTDKSHVVTLLLPKNTLPRRQVYRVETDVPARVLSFPGDHTEVVTQPNRRGEYKLAVSLARSGTFHGMLVFSLVDHELTEHRPKHRLHYELNIRIKSAPPIGTLEVVCPCLEVKEIVLPLKYPDLRTGERLQVMLDGPDLSGPDVVEVDTDQCEYIAQYRPTRLGTSEASLTFYNRFTSEFWIRLILTALPPLPITVAPVSCELGRAIVDTVKVENPTAQQYQLNAEITNPDVYSIESFFMQGEEKEYHVTDNGISLLPLATLRLNVAFQPQEYGEELNAGEIILRCTEFRELRVVLRGEGLLPSPTREVTVKSDVEGTKRFSIPFANPFPYTIEVTHYVTAKKCKDALLERHLEAFEVVGKKSQLLQAKQTTNLPCAFTPSHMQIYEVVFNVGVRKLSPTDGAPWKQHEIVWSYPVKGIAVMRGFQEPSPRTLLKEHVYPCEEPTPNRPARIEGEARSSTSFRLCLNLAGYLDNRERCGEEGSFTWSFSVQTSGDDLLDAAALVNVSVKLRRESCTVDPMTGVANLAFIGTFEPPRSFEIMATLSVTSVIGGEWQFPVFLQARRTELVESKITFFSDNLHKPIHRNLLLDSGEP
uniref:Calponin-homology (CH) domain-containing protein n=1 Tax=Mesocestoides corti TaxID=53468 RepID=A0A5K3FH90_MESCO